MNDSIIKSNLETIKHIHAVRSYLHDMIAELDNRARNHDNSKLESPEQEIFGEHYEGLAKTEYGSGIDAMITSISIALNCSSVMDFCVSP